jgi:MFS transporter, DHA1 family, tetracycline resistance protein
MKFEHRAVPIVLTAVLIDVIGLGIVMPVLPALILELGVTDLEQGTRLAGWMLAAFAIAGFFAGPVLGNLGDRFGRRPVLLFSMLAFAIDYALMAVAPSIVWLFVGRVIAGIAGATFGPASAVIADVTPPEKRSGAFGMVGAAFGIGFILGPALGGLASTFGVRAPFYVAAGCAALNGIIMLFFLPETLAQENRRPFRLRDAHVIGAFKPLFHAGNAAPLLVAWFLWQLAGVVYPATWSFWATIQFGWDARAIGWSLAYVGFLMAAVQMLLTSRAIKRMGERNAAILGLACAGVTLLSYAFVTQGWQVYAFFLVGALGALVYPAMNGTLSRMVDASHQGALQGGIASMNNVAAVIGPPIAAQALAEGVERGFAGAAFILAGALMLIAGLIIALRVPHVRDAEPSAPTITGDHP